MRNEPSAIMVFAAGFGTRMGALTADRPKPLIPVGGRPLIDHALALIDDAEIPRVVANVHYRADQMAQHLEGRGVRVSYEQPDILDTGGGLRQALPLLGDGPVYTLNSDAIWQGPNPLRLLAGAWQPDRMDALLMLVRPQDARGHLGAGDFTRAPDHRLARGAGLIYAGAQIIKPDLLHHIENKVFSLNLLWDQMLAKKRLYGIAYDGTWCDVGHPEGIVLAVGMLGGHGV